MDLFKFNNPTEPTLMEQGEIINDLKSKMWVERYDKAGEVELISNASDGIRDILPTGSFVSHVDTKEIMIIENHEISDDRGKETTLKTTGRGFETFFENRIVGSNGSFPEETSGNGDVHFLNTGELWTHVVQLISDHVIAATGLDAGNVIPYLDVFTDLSGVVDPRSRNIERGTLYSRVLELLKIDDLGIRVIRPSNGEVNIKVEIHRGVDRSSEIIFSNDTGEIESADYLWSLKNLKNAALITGKWIQTIYLGPETGINRRMMEINGESIDGAYTVVPTGVDLTNVVAGMQQLAIDTLASQKEVALTNANVSKEVNKAGYRTDFDVGDIITVSGDYSATSAKRISEYVEIEDEHGMNGYPTLTDI